MPKSPQSKSCHGVALNWRDIYGFIVDSAWFILVLTLKYNPFRGEERIQLIEFIMAAPARSLLSFNGRRSALSLSAPVAAAAPATRAGFATANALRQHIVVSKNTPNTREMPRARLSTFN